MRLQIFKPKRIMLCIAMMACPAFAAEDHPKAELFGGYQYTLVGIAPGISANGWNAAVTGNVNRWFGVTADLSGAYHTVIGTGLRAHTYTFGPTFALRGDRVTPFAHLLLGGFHSSVAGLSFGLNGFAMMAGGGVDVRVWKTVSVRPFQLDWLLWHAAGFSERKNARISSGVVIGIN
jgi:hypothetical protein